MRSLNALSIRGKLIAIVMLATTAALVVSGLLLVAFEVVSYRRTTERELQTLAEAVGINTTAALAFEDKRGAEEILSALRAQPSIRHACLYSHSGALFASYEREGVADDACASRIPVAPFDGGNEEISFEAPVLLEGERIGSLLLRAELEELWRRIALYTLVLLFILLAAALAGYLVSSRLQRLVSAPILELARTARRISEDHDYSLRAHGETSDEVRVAIDAFNQMLDRIRDADAAVRRAGEASRSQAQILQSVLHNMGEGLIVCDAQGRFVLWNPAATRLLGEQSASIDMREWPRHYRIYGPDRQSHYQADDMPLARALRGESITDAELCVCPPGERAGRWLSITARPLQDSRGVRAGIAVLRDVTERIEAAEQLRALNATLEHRVAERTAAAEQRAAELKRSNEELEAFAYVASHDLQEPLRAVASYTQLLEQRVSERADSETRLFMEHIVSGVVRMRALIRDLVDYSRVGRGQPVLRATDVGAVLSAAQADLAAAIAESGAVVTHGELPTVMADPVQLRQVFTNLLANAIKFRASAPPFVEVTAERLSEHWHFAVRDNGVGIDPRFHDRIFIIFQRLHGRDLPGTGIGLTICKRIVDRNGGRIWVDSAPGQGSTFHFTWAASEEHAS